MGVEPRGISKGPEGRTRAATRTIRRLGRAYSRFVALSKFVLPAAALGLVAVIAAWPSLVNAPITFKKPEGNLSEIVNPKYLSVDDRKQPYSLTAARADQSGEFPGLTALSKPEAEMFDQGGAWVVVTAEKGWYDRSTGVVRMVDNVHVLRDDGGEFTTDEAFSDVREGDAWGDRRVIGQGPSGEIDADGFRLTEHGKNVVFINDNAAKLRTRSGGSRPPEPTAVVAPAGVGPVDVAAVPGPSPTPVVVDAPIERSPAGVVLPGRKPVFDAGGRSIDDSARAARGE